MFKYLFVGCILSGGFCLYGDTVITISGSSFIENVTVVETGDMVTWENNGGFHNVVSDDGLFTSGTPSSSMWIYSYTYTEPGIYPYYCEIHGGAGGQGMSGVVFVGDVKVAIQNNIFTPEVVNIFEGQTVVWENQEGMHNVEADDGTFISGEPENGLWAYSFTFNDVADYLYHCDLHGAPGGVGMSGQILVTCDETNYQLELGVWPESSIVDLLLLICLSE